MLQDMSKAPLKVIGEYLQMDGEVANFNKAMELSMLIHHLPKIVAHYEAKATDSATRAMEANLQGSLHTGSGTGGGSAA
ncbi:hypothetical protein M3M44_09270, partial [Lactobacillus johnsonii]|uniref:hypothetical protein n=1 Tax=Lactobacillus johnsonii TaxID=33959 RepID=UPI00201A3D07